MTFFVVACLSASSLLFELLLTRTFSLAHWYHLSFMVIGVAMFGNAGAGVFFALGNLRRRGRAEGLPAISFLCALSTMGSFLLLKVIPLDYLRFPLERIQLLYLLVTDLLLSVPFFFAGLGICIAYVRVPERSGTVSFSALTGAGIGAVLPATLLPVFGIGGTTALAAVLALVPALFLTRKALLAACVLLAAGIVVLVVQRSGTLAVRPSLYKALPQLLQMPGSRLVSSSTSIWGSLDSIESPTIRFAPGLSLSFDGVLPKQSAITVDGDDLTVLSDIASPRASMLARSTHPYAGYVVQGHPRDSLVIQEGGGIGLACAVASGATRITVVVEQPGIAREMTAHYSSHGIETIAENPRSFIARAGPRFDTIEVEDWGPSIPGMASLSEQTIFTIEAFQGYWRRLGDSGVLIVSRRLLLPPSDSPRLFATALLALRREGIQDPPEHIAVIRNWDTCTLLVSRLPVRGPALASLRSFADTMGFDLDWFPGITPADAEKYNRITGAPFFAVYASLAHGQAPAVFEFLDTAPQSDGRPFPNHFVRLTRLEDYFRSTGSRPYNLLLSGEMVAGSVFLGSLLISVPLLIVPILLLRRRQPNGVPSRGRFPPRLFLYFAGSGLGYLFAEIAFLDALILLFGNPFVTLSVVLGGVLVFSGVGGRIAEALPRRALAPVLMLLAALFVALLLFLHDAVRLVLPFPLGSRIVCALSVLAVPGLLMGMPFPIGMRHEPADEGQRALAWAANGSASVVASAVSPLLAMSIGTGALLMAAAAGYCLVLLAASLRKPGAVRL
jgi:hypothetical protein